MDRAIEQMKTLWCSWGRHKVIRHPEAKEQYPNGSICLECQVQIMGNLEKTVFMPELSEAMKLRARVEWEKNRARMVAAAPLRRADPTAEGVVYYMRINGRIKIGYTSDLTKRSRAYPPDTELLAVEPGGRDLEHQRHVQFARYLDRGREWFTEGPLLVEHIRSVADSYSVPSELMYRFKKHRGSNA